MKAPYKIKSFADSVLEDLLNGEITVTEAAEQFYFAGYTTYINEDYVLEKFALEYAKRR